MLVEYDPDGDAMYIPFTEEAPGRSFGQRVDEFRIVHHDPTDPDRVVGGEFVLVSRGLDLRGMPRADEIARAVTAIRERVTIRAA